MLEGQQLPAFTRLVFGGSGITTAIQLGIVGIIWLATLAYLGGPRLHGWLHRALPGRAGLDALPAALAPQTPPARFLGHARRAARRRSARSRSGQPRGPIHRQPRHHPPGAESSRPAAGGSQTARGHARPGQLAASCSGASPTPCGAAPVSCAPSPAGTRPSMPRRFSWSRPPPRSPLRPEQAAGQPTIQSADSRAAAGRTRRRAIQAPHRRPNAKPQAIRKRTRPWAAGGPRKRANR